MTKALVGVLAGLAMLGACETPTTAPASENAKHIAAIENGLLPPVIIKGRPLPVQNLQARMAATNTPAVSIAFFEDGKILWAKAYGFADPAAQVPTTPETLFQAASISKPVSAAAAMRLIQDGVLKLDEDVNEALKTWKVPPSAFTAERKVTLRGILSHSAGLTVPGFPGYAPGLPLPTTIQTLNGAPPSNTPAVVSSITPGERWMYSGGGYIVAQLLMTEATGKTYTQLMHDLVLKPAGMEHSRYDQPLSPEFKAQAAVGHFADGKPLPGGNYAYPELAPAGLWTTPSDLAHFAIALQDAYTGASDRLMNKVTAQLMLSRQIDDFGLGLNLGPAADAPMFEHGGSNQGFHSELRAFTTGRRQGVVIMTSSDGGLPLIGEILRAVATTYGWKNLGAEERTVIQPDSATLSALVGAYEVPSVATLSITVENGRLYGAAAPLGPVPLELLALTPTSFFILENGVTIDFVRNADGGVEAARIGGPYGQFTAKRKLA